MPLIHSKSKNALQKNIVTEMRANPDPKDRAKNIAIAYSVKRRAKKAQGGKISTDPKDYTTKDLQSEAKDKIDQQQKIDGYAEGGSINEKIKARQERGLRHYGGADAYHQKGVNMPSVAGPAAHIARHNSKEAVKSATEEMRKIEPKLQGLAEGGRVKTNKIKHPRMVASNVVQARLRDDEDDMMDSMPPSSPKDQPSKADDEKGPNRQGPDMKDLHMKKMAHGGKAEDDGVEHPAGLEEDDDQQRPSEDEIMSDHMEMLAEGGEVHSEDEIEHAASLAAAIMMKRKRMAMGGKTSMETTDADQADLSRNADEDMNLEDQASFDAMCKENYSESEGLEQLDSPMDSAQHGHEEDDEHDRSIVGQIRSKMKKKSAITR